MDRHLKALLAISTVFGFLTIVGIGGLFGARYYHNKAEELRRKEEHP